MSRHVLTLLKFLGIFGIVLAVVVTVFCIITIL